MPDRSPHRVARAAALACSVGLASLVIINAQFGCDAPATTAPPAKEAPAKAEPVVAPPEAEPEPAEPKQVEPEPAAEVQAKVEPEPAAKEEPVFMPASKSGGDFGAARFPGQAANPAPEPKAQK